MRKLSALILASCAIAVLLSSCAQLNVKKQTRLLLQAISEGDSATMVSIYPSLSSAENFTIKNLDVAKVSSVKKDSESNNFIATFNDGEDLVFSKNSDGQYVVVDSHNMIDLDEHCKNVAVKTGVPVNEISDMEVASFLSDSSGFMKSLAARHPHARDAALKETYSWCTLSNHFTIKLRNDSGMEIKGDDYRLNCILSEKPYYAKDELAYDSYEPGRTADPGKTIVITHDASSCPIHRQIYFSYFIEITGIPKAKLLDSLCELDSDEYEQYQKAVAFNNKESFGFTASGRWSPDWDAEVYFWEGKGRFVFKSRFDSSKFSPNFEIALIDGDTMYVERDDREFSHFAYSESDGEVTLTGDKRDRERHYFSGELKGHIITQKPEIFD